MFSNRSDLLRIYANSPSNCANKWCTNPGSIPTTGNLEGSSDCSSAQMLFATRDRTGGISGRGVVPCPFGHFRHTSNIQDATNQIFFQTNYPSFLPPSVLEVRPLNRIGNQWRN